MLDKPKSGDFGITSMSAMMDFLGLLAPSKPVRYIELAAIRGDEGDEGDGESLKYKFAAATCLTLKASAMLSSAQCNVSAYCGGHDVRHRYTKPMYHEDNVRGAGTMLPSSASSTLISGSVECGCHKSGSGDLSDAQINTQINNTDIDMYQGGEIEISPLLNSIPDYNPGYTGGDLADIAVGAIAGSAIGFSYSGMSMLGIAMAVLIVLLVIYMLYTHVKRSSEYYDGWRCAGSQCCRLNRT